MKAIHVYIDIYMCDIQQRKRVKDIQHLTDTTEKRSVDINRFE